MIQATELTYRKVFKLTAGYDIITGSYTMIELTKKEQAALLILYKDLTAFHNANSLSKLLGITQVGTMKLLKRLEKVQLIVAKRIGKSIVYKINVQNELAQKVLSFILVNEAQQYERWKQEFKSFYKKGRIILFYGSASRNYAQARDIDVLIVQEKEGFKDVHTSSQAIQQTLAKKIHEIQATKEELARNLRDRNETMIEIIKTAIVLYGYDEYMEVLNGFASF